ncbi:MAG TPA: prepilin peptidase [Xanthobacteraceae bacterium]|nr:prepilin peptidase [Xanthobacteraceae bacterium]
MLAEILVLGLFPAAMAFAAASDLITMTISNRLSLALCAAFFLVAMAVGMPVADMGRHVLASLVVLAVAFAFFARGWIGGGDAKLAAATALWLGFAHLMDYLLVASVIGGVLTLLILELRRLPLPAVLARKPWIARLHDVKTGIPYGIALALAGLAVYPDSAFMRALAG